MNTQKSQLYFLLAMLIGTIGLSVLVFRPFIFSLILAVVFAVVFRPVHLKIQKITGSHEGFAALLTTITVIVVILVPLLLLGSQIFREASQIYGSLVSNGGKDQIVTVLNSMVDELRKYVPIRQDFSVNLTQYTKQVFAWLLQNAGSVFTNAATILVDSFVFTIALYYLFKDGHRLKDTVVALSPLADTDDQSVFVKLTRAINSVVKGNLLLAIVHGLLISFGFWFFGISNPILWGCVGAIAALIPGVGGALVIIPAALYLFFTNNTFGGFGMLVWGFGSFGLADNFLGPMLVGRGTQLHPAIVLLSVLGGIALFGPFGFLLGPLTLSLLFALFDIYSSLMKVA